jgi:hypothetical protein
VIRLWSGDMELWITDVDCQYGGLGSLHKHETHGGLTLRLPTRRWEGSSSGIVGGEDRASEQATHAQIRNNDLQDVNVTGRNQIRDEYTVNREPLHNPSFSTT